LILPNLKKIVMTVISLEKSSEILRKSIRDIPDFPKPGIVFKDITTLLSDPAAFKLAIDLIVQKYKSEKIDFVVVPESRGFIFGAPVAIALGAGLTLVRKPGKLPSKTLSKTYQLEYGTDTLCIHEDAFAGVENPKVIIVDDLIATGGSCLASAELVRELGANLVGAAFVIELSFLPGRQKLESAGIDVYSLISY
jgi:adenine phosphoribosyltransferase